MPIPFTLWLNRNKRQRLAIKLRCQGIIRVRLLSWVVNNNRESNKKKNKKLNRWKQDHTAGTVGPSIALTMGISTRKCLIKGAKLELSLKIETIVWAWMAITLTSIVITPIMSTLTAFQMDPWLFMRRSCWAWRTNKLAKYSFEKTFGKQATVRNIT